MLRISSCVLVSVAASVTFAVAGSMPPADDRNQPIYSVAASLATELAKACPLGEADDQHAFDTCRQTLFRSKTLPLAKIVVWGTEHKGKLVKDMELTQFDSEMWAGLYLSLWMFTGEWQVVYDEIEGENVVLLQTKFRNRLDPGQYPYPFWHSSAKWNDWQDATALKIHVDESGERIVAFLRSKNGERVAGAYPDIAPRAFDGKWRWPAADGTMEPRVTLFEGLYRKDNPHLLKLESSYQDFANEMRRATCSGCHVPNNPERMRRLVLLQSPAHAAAEIERVIKSVRDEKMPQDDGGEPAHLDPAVRAAFLDEAARFQAVVEQAKAWEKERQRNSDEMTVGRSTKSTSE